MNYNHDNLKRKKKALTSKLRTIPKKFSIFTCKYTIVFLLGLLIVGVGAGLGMIHSLIDNAPNITLKDVQPEGFLTTIYDQNGEKLLTLSDYDSNRIYVTIDKIPKHLQDAFIAIEDERFYSHNGIDPRGIARAFFVGVKNIFSGGNFSEGASTLTQQLIKNNVFAAYSEPSFIVKLERKIQEQYLALNLEKDLVASSSSKYEAKQQILEYYLNTINLGQSTLGVQAATHRYFNKDVNELTLSESAVIASITKNPSALDPVRHPKENSLRRETILKRMLDQKLITEKEYEVALRDPVYDRIKQVDTNQSQSSVYSYFMDALIVQVIEDLQEQLGYTRTQAYNALYRGGLSIYATQDSKIQSICDDIINHSSVFPDTTEVSLGYRLSIQKKDGTTKNYSEYDVERFWRKKLGTKTPQFIFSNETKAKQAALEFKQSVYQENKGDKILGEKLETILQPQVSFTLMDQKTGYVKAIVGGRGEKTANLTLNRATDTTRQPGSTFKIVSTYVPAIDTAGVTLATTFDDSPYDWPNTNTPVRNANRQYGGLTTIRKAIQNSTNVVAARTMELVTPQTAYKYLLDLGFTTLVEREVKKNGSVYSDIQYPLSLGGITNGVTNLELTAAYAAIANDGLYTKPTLYTKILDHEGKLLYHNKPQTKQVMKDTTAWLITNAMEDVVKYGTATATKLNNMTSAGKTGTTSDNYDFWFSGYTPYYTASIWYGYDLNRSFSSGNTHKILWKKIMDKIDQELHLKNKKFKENPSIVKATICTKSGKLAVSGLCDRDPRGSMVSTEYFANGTVPTDECDVHVKAIICAKSGQLVSRYCPNYDQISVIYMIPPKTASPYSADYPYFLPKNIDSHLCEYHTQIFQQTFPPEIQEENEDGNMDFENEFPPASDDPPTYYDSSNSSNTNKRAYSQNAPLKRKNSNSNLPED